MARSPGITMTPERIRLRDVGVGDVRVRIDVTGVSHSYLSVAHGVPGAAAGTRDSKR